MSTDDIPPEEVAKWHDLARRGVTMLLVVTACIVLNLVVANDPSWDDAFRGLISGVVANLLGGVIPNPNRG